jgi:NADH-quinone oxidoreductase subunit M
VGEFLILLGAYKANAIWAVLAATGVVLGAIYMLWMYQRVFFGPVRHAENEGLKDLNLREIVVFVPILVLIFVMGIYPKPFLSRMEPAVERFVAQVAEKRMGLEDGRGGSERFVIIDEAGAEGGAPEGEPARETTGEETAGETQRDGSPAGGGGK